MRVLVAALVMAHWHGRRLNALPSPRLHGCECLADGVPSGMTRRAALKAFGKRDTCGYFQPIPIPELPQAVSTHIVKSRLRWSECVADDLRSGMPRRAALKAFGKRVQCEYSYPHLLCHTGKDAA